MVKVHYTHLRNVISIPTSPRRKLKFHRAASVNITPSYHHPMPRYITENNNYRDRDSEKDNRRNCEIDHLVY